MNTAPIVSKVWSFCTTLRDDGVGYGDYLEQLTYLIFQRVLESQNVGLGSAGGVYASILANIVALFLMRIVGKNLDA